MIFTIIRLALALFRLVGKFKGLNILLSTPKDSENLAKQSVQQLITLQNVVQLTYHTSLSSSLLAVTSSKSSAARS
jgi:hypothetical protein